MQRRRREPYGAVEQRELAGLRCLGASSSAVAAFLVLRVREDAVTHLVSDGLASLASYGGMAEETMSGALAFLIDKGVVDQRPRQRRHGGPKGAAWVMPRRALPFSEWPEETMTVIASCAEVAHRHALTTGVSSDGKTPQSETEDALIGDRRRPNPPRVLQRPPSVLPTSRFATKDVSAAMREIGQPTVNEDGTVTTSTGRPYASMDAWAAAMRVARGVA